MSFIVSRYRFSYEQTRVKNPAGEEYRISEENGVSKVKVFAK